MDEVFVVVTLIIDLFIADEIFRMSQFKKLIAGRSWKRTVPLIAGFICFGLLWGNGGPLAILIAGLQP
jgi:hypothetical protein